MTSRSLRRVVVTGAGAALLAGLVLPGTSAAYAHADPTRPPALAESWLRTERVRLQGDSSLADVAGLSGTDVWAVGQQEIWDAWENRGAIAHWDGRAWTQVGIRNDDTGAGYLRSIAAAAANDLWTVGAGHDGLPYVAHGDGSGFDRVGVDQLRASDWLAGVAAVPGRMATVGSRDRKPLIVTRTGATWRVESMREEGTLYGVSLTAKGDGFAVGDAEGRPLIMRQSGGGAWKKAAVPRIRGGYLRDVHSDGPKRALAIGGVYRGSGEISPLVLSWNGKRWSQVKLPDGDARLYGVTGDGKGTFWISGHDPGRPGEAFLLRHQGKHTDIVRGESTGSPRTMRLQAVSHLPGTDDTVWAVGHVIDDKDAYTDVVERFGPKSPKALDGEPSAGATPATRS
ncbi:hypothetical protein C1I98_03815 [Spongiactinospora gelatinilytica]|uniref:Uncharacterized protein n=1 Tax=Spongiactinospora gelatinilytica TaxID=2666298 RepID=A0A2W2I8V5_9ACTN|nr:hypothetical protein [Spongiactinospora gelatinilytica]PZG54547.1 hypothetical protein C1I98_03815 [Spongiactinospora gelatinilytica]